MARGKFITLEGGEGTGKSTLIKALAAWLAEHDVSYVQTREPGGTPLAEAVRAMTLNPPSEEEWTPYSQALLMNTARSEHLERLIRPALAQGQWVLCDRFADSTLVYQSAQGLEMEVLRTLENLTIGDTIPDLTIILEGDPVALLERRKERSEAETTDMFERKNISFHEQIRQGFLSVGKTDTRRYVILDALQPAESVARAAIEAITQRLGAL